MKTCRGSIQPFKNNLKVKPLNKSPIKIKKGKWNHFQSLKNVIPKNHHNYYNDLKFIVTIKTIKNIKQEVPYTNINISKKPNSKNIKKGVDTNLKVTKTKFKTLVAKNLLTLPKSCPTAKNLLQIPKSSLKAKYLLKLPRSCPTAKNSLKLPKSSLKAKNLFKLPRSSQMTKEK